MSDLYAEFTGETVQEPWDRYVRDPGRSIPITPEVRARDLAQQAERLLKSMRDEERRVQLDERKAVRHVYKDW